jgi:ribosomal protein L11 methyltransferase
MIHVLCGDASLLQASKYDLILANINRNILLEDMKTYARSLRPGGELFISGFYTEDVPMLLEEASKYSLEMVSSRERDRWSMVRLISPIHRNN